MQMGTTNPILTDFERLPGDVRSALMQNQDIARYYAAMYGNYANKSAVIMVPAMLRLETLIGTSNQLTFDAAITQSKNASEIRLNTADNFHLTGYALGLYKSESGASTTHGVTDVVHLWPNPLVFNGVTGVNESEQLNAIFNGVLGCVLNSRQVMKNAPLINTLNVGTAQFRVSLTENDASPGIYQRSEQQPNNFWTDYSPGLKIEGASTPQFTITMGASAAAGGQGGSANYAVLFLKGFLAQTVN